MSCTQTVLRVCAPSEPVKRRRLSPSLPSWFAGVILIHSTGEREGDNVNRYKHRISPNMKTGWSAAKWVEVEGDIDVGTFTFMNTPSLPVTIAGREEQYKYLGGYEGWQGEACLAHSSDGVHWQNLHSKGCLLYTSPSPRDS